MWRNTFFFDHKTVRQKPYSITLLKLESNIFTKKAKKKLNIYSPNQINL
jgi:hypothetical protein